MTQTKPTPGPWSIPNRDGNGYLAVAPDTTDGRLLENSNGSMVICKLYGPDEIDNASLIAAAPELLEALQMMTGAFIDPEDI